jgi:putative heme-binding domain-containing protein
MADALKDSRLSIRMYWACSTALARLDGQEVNEGKLADLFLARATDEQTEPEVRARALQLVPARHPKLTLDLLRKLLSHADPNLRREAARALAEHPSSRRASVLLEVARDDKGMFSNEVRAWALVGLADKAQERVSEVSTIAAYAMNSVVRDEALRALVDTELKAEQLLMLKSVNAREEATRDLLQRAQFRQPFFRARPPAKDIAAWLKLLEGPGDAAAGQRIFGNPRLAGCARCHRVEGRGSDVGPDLSSIGRTERRHIVESILQPSNAVAPHYQVWLIETSDGRVRTGMLVHTNLDEYTYLDEKGGQFKVNTRDVVATRPAATSIMPEGLVDRLTDQEIRDLLAYLCSRR